MPYRNTPFLRQCVLGALFAASIGAPRLATGYTMTVWGDPYDGWGCVGACGGWGYGDDYFDPYHGPDTGGGSGGDAGEPGSSADSPIDVDVRASGTCSPAETREYRAGSAVRAWLIAQGDIGDCTGNRGEDKYYFVRFQDGLGGTYQWRGECVGSTFMIEISAQC